MDLASFISLYFISSKDPKLEVLKLHMIQLVLLLLLKYCLSLVKIFNYYSLRQERKAVYIHV